METRALRLWRALCAAAPGHEEDDGANEEQDTDGEDGRRRDDEDEEGEDEEEAKAMTLSLSRVLAAPLELLKDFAVALDERTEENIGARLRHPQKWHYAEQARLRAQAIALSDGGDTSSGSDGNVRTADSKGRTELRR